MKVKRTEAVESKRHPRRRPSHMMGKLGFVIVGAQHARGTYIEPSWRIPSSITPYHNSWTTLYVSRRIARTFLFSIQDFYIIPMPDMNTLGNRIGVGTRIGPYSECVGLEMNRFCRFEELWPNRGSDCGRTWSFACYQIRARHRNQSRLVMLEIISWVWGCR